MVVIVVVGLETILIAKSIITIITTMITTMQADNNITKEEENEINKLKLIS